MRNIAEINLNVLKKNALTVKKRLPPETKFCAVLKADAYGHGAPECAAALYGIADCFAVALVEEGIELKLSGIDKEVIVLIPAAKEEAERAARYSLSLSAASASDLKAINAAGKKLGKKINVHLAYNSGMNRLGASDEEIKEITDYAKKCEFVSVKGFFSHFACPENDFLRERALKKFLSAAESAKKAFGDITLHISASGGLLKGVTLDMVRVGILLYGYKPFPFPINVKPVMKVYSKTLAKRVINRGETVLYGDNALKEKTPVSIIRAGYADGLFREKKGNLINNRCMDLSAIKGHTDSPVIMEDAEKVAREHNTISYEILCAATRRAERKYIR